MMDKGLVLWSKVNLLWSKWVTLWRNVVMLGIKRIVLWGDEECNGSKYSCYRTKRLSGSWNSVALLSDRTSLDGVISPSMAGAARL